LKKGHDLDALERLHEKGYISDPKSKSKSVVMSAEGAQRAQELFEKHFAQGRGSATDEPGQPLISNH